MLHLVNFSSSESRADSANNSSSAVPQSKRRSRRRRRMNCKQKVEPVQKQEQQTSKVHDAPMTKNDLYFALDCEMVGVGLDGLESAVARVTVINWEKEVVLDTYVKVPVPVTDYRTHVSGITPEDIHSNDAMTFQEARAAVENILRGKILIGHGLDNDLCSLGLSHPWSDVRDTALYAPYMREVVDYENGKLLLRPRKLRDLTWEKLASQIQDEGKPHSPLEDAGAAMDLYKASRQQWEEDLRCQQAMQFKQAAEQQRKPRSTFAFMTPQVPEPSYPQEVQNTPYQIPYDPSVYRRPYGPQFPVSSPPPAPPVPVEPRRQTSRRWFSRDTSPEKNAEKKDQDDFDPVPPSRPSSPRSSGLFSSFRRSSTSKRGVQQSSSTDTDTTSGTDANCLDYNSEGLDWSQVEEAPWQPPQTKRQSSRLFAYLSLGRTECEDDEMMKIHEDCQEQKTEWEPSWDER